MSNKEILLQLEQEDVEWLIRLLTNTEAKDEKEEATIDFIYGVLDRVQRSFRKE